MPPTSSLVFKSPQNPPWGPKRSLYLPCRGKGAYFALRSTGPGWGCEAPSSLGSWAQFTAGRDKSQVVKPSCLGSTRTLEEPQYALGVMGDLGREEQGKAANGASTYLRGCVHLLGAVHRQGDLAPLATWGCALHHQPLCGESLEPGGRRTTVH